MRTIVFVFVLVGAGCGIDLGPCPPDSAALQKTGRQVVNNRCVECHGTRVLGEDRHEAPAAANWDDLGKVRRDAQAIYGDSTAGSMPPPVAGKARLAPEELEAMRVWLACGAQDL